MNGLHQRFDHIIFKMENDISFFRGSYYKWRKNLQQHIIFDISYHLISKETIPKTK